MIQTTLLLLALSPAAEPGDPVKLQAPPAGLPTPTTRLRLLPGPEDLTPGDAAALFYRTFAMFSEQTPEFLKRYRGNYTPGPDGELEDDLLRWRRMPLQEMPREAVREELRFYQSLLHELDVAARRKDCDWGLANRPEGMGLLLPELQSFRRLTEIGVAQARLLMLDGDRDGAVRTMQTFLSIDRHLARGPSMIHQLIAFYFAAMVLDQVEVLLQQPGTPNLYWALTDLPAPFCNPAVALEAERDWLEDMMPALRPFREGMAGREAMLRLQREVRAWKESLNAKVPSGGFPNIVIVAAADPEARRRLRTYGFSEEEIQQIQPVQAVLRAALLQHRFAHDEYARWLRMPFAQAYPFLAAAERDFDESTRPLDEVLTGGTIGVLTHGKDVFSFLQKAARFDRRITALRVLEAVRLHAHENQGKPPQTLDAITAVPVPADPLSGKPFRYTVERNCVRLEAELPPGMTDKQWHLTYELTLLPPA